MTAPVFRPAKPPQTGPNRPRAVMTGRVLRSVASGLAAVFSPWVVMGIIAWALGLFLMGGEPWEGWESE